MENAGLFSSIAKKSGYLSSKSLSGDLGILFFVLSFSFLGYKLLAFNQYDALVTQWEQMPLSQGWWLVGVLILIPANWYLEGLKWKMLTSGVQKLTLNDSIRAVLAGISTGFFTPNRIGELVGRVAFLDSRNRKSGVTLSIVNSLTQNIVMALCGIPACILFFTMTKGKLKPDFIHFILMLSISILIFGLIYFSLPLWSQQLKKSRLTEKIKSFTDCLSDYNQKNLLQIMGVSLFRYIIFSSQFYLMLRFFSVELSPWQALISIPTSYLFVTFTPSLAFSEAAVRSSYAVLVIGVFSTSIVSIALSGICIWAVNFIIPMVTGSVVLVRKRLSSINGMETEQNIQE
jgi:uncharacterized membrane protein YbhN (UPF0104 family)